MPGGTQAPGVIQDTAGREPFAKEFTKFCVKMSWVYVSWKFFWK
jgi:hypothetical protein